jgi:hypothetical protein
LTNKAFDLFTQDYTQARSTYLSALNTVDATAARTAFVSYTTARVDLLAQQVVSKRWCRTTSMVASP